MRIKLSLGLTPHEEDCVQVRSGANYLPAMRKEAQRYRDGILKFFAPAVAAAPGIEFRIASHGHDFGTYLEVEVILDDADPVETSVAYHIEDHSPGTWDELEHDVSQWTPETGAHTTTTKTSPMSVRS